MADALMTHKFEDAIGMTITRLIKYLVDNVCLECISVLS